MERGQEVRVEGVREGVLARARRAVKKYEGQDACKRDADVQAEGWDLVGGPPCSYTLLRPRTYCPSRPCLARFRLDHSSPTSRWAALLRSCSLLPLPHHTLSFSFPPSLPITIHSLFPLLQVQTHLQPTLPSTFPAMSDTRISMNGADPKCEW